VDRRPEFCDRLVRGAQPFKSAVRETTDELTFRNVATSISAPLFNRLVALMWIAGTASSRVQCGLGVDSLMIRAIRAALSAARTWEAGPFVRQAPQIVETRLIAYTMIGLTVLSNRTSLSGSRASGDRHRSDLLIRLPNTKRQQMIMCKMVFAY
jgi:hypothetical protein